MGETPEGVYELEDPTVLELGRFLRRARLANGTFATIPVGMSELLAQAVCNWFANWVFDDGRWVSRAAIEADPDFGDVEVTVIGDDEVVKLRHRVTGIVALAETKPDAWRELRDKVRAAGLKGGSNGNDE